MGNIYLWPGFFWTLLNIAIFLGSKIQHSTSAGFNVQQSSKTQVSLIWWKREEKNYENLPLSEFQMFLIWNTVKLEWMVAAAEWGPLPREVPMCWFRWVLGQKVGQKVQIGIQVGDGQVQCWAWQANILTPIHCWSHHTLLPPQPKRKRDKEKSGW